MANEREELLRKLTAALASIVQRSAAENAASNQAVTEPSEHPMPISIDNSNVSYRNRVLCIRLNDKDPSLASGKTPDAREARKNKLKSSYDYLARKYKGIKSIEGSNPLNTILQKVFVNGIMTTAYVRNLSYDVQSGYSVPVIAIRPKTYPMDYIHQILPEGVSLIFRGHIYRSSFVVDRIYDAADTEKLDFEVESSFIPRRQEYEVYEQNFLKEVLNDAASLANYTRQRLELWQGYLRWKKEISERQIHGVKYYKLSYNAKKKRIIVHLVCRDKESFVKIQKYLAQDMQLFDNNYSSDSWEFDFSNDRKNRGSEPKELGRYRGIAAEYYLEAPKNEQEMEESDEIADISDTEYESFYPEEDEDDNSEFISSKKELTDNDLLQHFERPYIVEVAYELSRSTLDELQSRTFASKEDEQHYITANILSGYYKNGFLAKSAVGDFVLISRFERAIRTFENDEYWSPNLAVWLFDISKARLPDPMKKTEITEWLNQDISKNENQKTAVQKMIDAPDICLIQGPPGTGKTTVIAEAVYQLVKQGLRVLIASQSNDAVDNALERLADTPIIRAVRIGQSGSKRKKDESVIQKFNENEALKYYYNSVSSGISEKWLNVWSGLEKTIDEQRMDRRDALNFRQDIVEYESQLNAAAEAEAVCVKQMQESSRAMDEALNHNNELRSQQQQLQFFSNRIAGCSDEAFYLSDNALAIAERELSSIIAESATKGVMLIPDGNALSLSIQGNNSENRLLNMLISRVRVITGLADKLEKSKSEACGDSRRIIALQEEESKLKNKLLEAAINNDSVALDSLRREIQTVMLEIQNAQLNTNGIIMTDEEKQVLYETLLERIISGNTQGIEATLHDAATAAMKALRAAEDNIRSALNAVAPENIQAYNDEFTMRESQYNEAHSIVVSLRGELSAKQNTLRSLAEKYNAPASDSESVLAAIDSAIEKSISELERYSDIRSAWGSVMEEFREHLSGKAFKHDGFYYNQTYLRSCNVVGVSCTDKKLSEFQSEYDDFDVVIIDEVSKATPPELLIPLMRAKKAILVGDHRQLPPMFKEHEQSYNELIEDTENIPSDISGLITAENFNRYKSMVTSSLFKEYFEQAHSSIKHSLLVQYRMHSDITSVINRFYEMRLENGFSAEEEKQLKNHGVYAPGEDGAEFIIPEKHAYWIDSSELPSGRPMYDSRAVQRGNTGGTSVFNIYEKHLVIESLKKIADSLRNTGERKSVGVISFYQSQVNRIREAFREARKEFDFSPIDVDINTVDRFQGKEKNIVLVSLVRNNRSARAGEHIVAFERINVAFSRAQQMLVIIGAKHLYEAMDVKLPNMDSEGYTTSKIYLRIIEELNRNGALKSGSALITPELEQKIIQEYEGKDD